MSLATIQRDLAALYESPLEHGVLDFLVTDPDLARRLHDSASADNAERLLLRQTDETLDITLFVDAAVLAQLDLQDPYAALGAHNLNAFLVALEGVSHFNYVVWNARYARPVSLLELELQAEVDKYVSLSIGLARTGNPVDAGRLHERLFSEVGFNLELDASSRTRYAEANHLAGKYCQGLMRRFPAQHLEPLFVQELRRFYRLPQNDKIRFIHAR